MLSRDIRIMSVPSKRKREKKIILMKISMCIDDFCGAGVVCGSNVELPGGSVDKSKTASATVCNWGKCLEVILASEFTGPLEQDACGLYKIEIDVDGVKVMSTFLSLK